MGCFVVIMIVLSLLIGKWWMWLLTILFGLAWMGNKIQSEPSINSQGSKKEITPDYLNIREDLISVCKNFSGNNYYILDLIPSQKLDNSKKNYSVPDGGPVIALIDLTANGEAEFGLAIGQHGICWRGQQNSCPIMMYWEEFSSVIIENDGQNNLKIGNRQIDISSSPFAKDKLFTLLNKIQLCVLEYNTSGRSTQTENNPGPEDFDAPEPLNLKEDLINICKKYRGSDYYNNSNSSNYGLNSIPSDKLNASKKNYPVPENGSVIALIYVNSSNGLAIGEYGISWRSFQASHLMRWMEFSSALIVRDGSSVIKIGEGRLNMTKCLFETDKALELLKRIQQRVIIWNSINSTTFNENKSPHIDNLLDINTADYDTLLSLPGIGAVEAKRLVEHRQQHGPFSSIDTVSDFLKLKPHHTKQWEDKVIFSNTPEPAQQQADSELQKPTGGRTID